MLVQARMSAQGGTVLKQIKRSKLRGRHYHLGGSSSSLELISFKSMAAASCSWVLIVLPVTRLLQQKCKISHFSLKMLVFRVCETNECTGASIPDFVTTVPTA